MKTSITLFLILLTSSCLNSKSLLFERPSKTSQTETTEPTSTTSTNLTKEPQTPSSRVTLVPSQATFDRTMDLLSANGTYTAPNKMWYFSKSYSAATFSSTVTSLNMTPVLTIDFRLPRQIKELIISVVVPGVSYVCNAETSNFPGFSAVLEYDNLIIDRFTVQSREAAGRSITRTLTMEGVVYNVPAGNHKVQVELASTNSNTVNFFAQETIERRNMQIRVDMVGYVALD